MLGESFAYAVITTNAKAQCEYCLARTAVAALAFGHGEDQDSYFICADCLENWRARVKTAESLQELRPNFV